MKKQCSIWALMFAFGCAHAVEQPLTTCKAPTGKYALFFDEAVYDSLVPTCGGIDPIVSQFPFAIEDTNPQWKASQSSTTDNCFFSYSEKGHGGADGVFCYGGNETIDIYRQFMPQEDGSLQGSMTVFISCGITPKCGSTYTITGVPAQ